MSDWESEILPVKIRNVDELIKAFRASIPVVQEPQDHLVANQITLNNGAGQGGPTQLLQLNPNRISAQLAFALNAPATVTAEGVTGTAPAINTTIASISAAVLQGVAPIGSLFNVSWTVDLEGTAAAGDANNAYLSSPLNTVRQQGAFPAVVGAYTQEGLTDFSPGASGINAQVGPGAGTAAAIYAAQISATPVGIAQVLICHSQASAQKALAGTVSEGFLLPVGYGAEVMVPIRSSAPVWAVPVGNAIITASVLSEIRG